MSHGLERTRNVAKNWNLALPWIRSSSWWTTDGVALGLVATLHVQNPLGRDRQGKWKSTHTKSDSQWCPGNAFAHFTKKWRENYGCPYTEGFERLRRRQRLGRRDSFSLIKPHGLNFRHFFLIIHILYVCTAYVVQHIYTDTLLSGSSRDRCQSSSEA